MAQMRSEGASHHDIRNEHRDVRKRWWRKHRTALVKGESISVLMDASVHTGIDGVPHRPEA